MPLSTNDLRHHAFTLDISVSQGHPERLSGKRGSVHRSTAEFYLIPRVILGLLHFALFLCPCEVVFSSPKQSQKLLSRNRIASLRSQRRRKRLSDCFGPSALAMTGKSHCEVVVSPFFFVTASLVCSSGEAISDCFASLATAKNAAGLLRFACSDNKKGEAVPLFTRDLPL
jgi:hypothetical protein